MAQNTAAHRSKPKGLFVPDAFTNPAHVQFALKVMFAAMFCYIVHEGIDWSGITANRAMKVSEKHFDGLVRR